MCNFNLVRALPRGAKNAGKTVATRGLRLAMFRSPSQLAARFLKGLTSTATDYGQGQLHCISTIQGTNMKRCIECVIFGTLQTLRMLVVLWWCCLDLLRSQVCREGCKAIVPWHSECRKGLRRSKPLNDMLGRANPSPSAFPRAPSWQKGGRA